MNASLCEVAILLHGTIKDLIKYNFLYVINEINFIILIMLIIL